MAVFLTASYPPLSKPLNTVIAMTDYPLNMKAVGDGNFVVHCGMREDVLDPVWYWSCDASTIGTAPLSGYSYYYPEIGDPMIHWHQTIDSVPGKIAEAIEFNKLEVDSSYNSLLMAGSEVSCSMWIKKVIEFSTTNIPSFGIVYKGTSFSADFYIAIRLSSVVSLQIVDKNSGAVIYAPLSFSWDHFVVVYSVSGGFIKIYKNGSLISTNSGLSLITLPTAGRAIWSNYKLGDSGSCDVDDIKSFDVALTQEQVTTLYNSY